MSLALQADSLSLSHQGSQRLGIDVYFSGGSVVKNPPASAGDARGSDLIPGLGRSPGVRNGNPLPYPCLGNPMDRGALWLQSIGTQTVLHE